MSNRLCRMEAVVRTVRVPLPCRTISIDAGRAGRWVGPVAVRTP